jgi:hypothetical protein
MHLPSGVVQPGLCAFVIRILRQDAPVSCLSVGVVPRLQLRLTERKSCAVHSWIERKCLPELRNCGVVLLFGEEDLSEPKMRECFAGVLLLQMLEKCRCLTDHSELQKNCSKFFLVGDVVWIRVVSLL